MPDKVEPPATSVCFSLWDLINKQKFTWRSKCWTNNRVRSGIIECQEELIAFFSVYDILKDKTKSPISMLMSAEVRDPPASNWTSWNDTDQVLSGQETGYITEFYKGPYKCIRFQAVSKEGATQFKLDRMTTGYPKARFFTKATMDVNPHSTPDIISIRLFITENGTYPRGSVTLPVVANTSKALSYIISYRRIETQYLTYPYSFRCIDYSQVQKIESREHCIEDCVKKKISRIFGRETLPSDVVIFQNEKQEWPNNGQVFVSGSNETVDEEEEVCFKECPLDCFTRTFYTTQSETSSDTSYFTFSTRFEEPETLVKFIPKFDLQAYIIYVAGVISIWFSASIFHSVTDVYRFSHKFILYLKDILSNRHQF